MTYFHTLGELHLFIWGATPVNREAAPCNGREHKPKNQRNGAKPQIPRGEDSAESGLEVV